MQLPFHTPSVVITECQGRIFVSPAPSESKTTPLTDSPHTRALLARLSERVQERGAAADAVAAISALASMVLETPGASHGGLAPWQRRAALALLESDLSGPLSVVHVAACCRLSRAHFTRAFGQTMGVAPYQWRMARRMSEARRLLVDSSLRIQEVAAACGFGEMSHFSHAFSAATGLSPRRWRARFGARGVL